MIQKLSLNTQTIWMIFIKILKNTIQMLIAFDNMIADMFRDRKLELFIRKTKLSCSEEC